tara:strand:- start:114 stop:575 length:462 start_codon:yes stop_codon:yes gene_type:complete
MDKVNVQSYITDQMMKYIIMNMIQHYSIYLKNLLFIFLNSIILSQEVEDDTLSLDLNTIWEEAVWEEIEDVIDVYYEVEQVTAVAGVRGSEAEDEALHYLYYRKSMKGISIQEYKKAYGKLKNKRDELYKKDKNNPKLQEMDNYLSYIRKKII